MSLNKRGMILVEAAIVMPITIIITVSMIVMMITMFDDFETEKQLIKYSKIKAGEESKTVIRDIDQNISDNMRIYIKKFTLFPKVITESEKKYKSVFLNKKILRKEESYIVNEKKFARSIDKISSAIK
mgnify:CR=1 FL=1